MKEQTNDICENTKFLHLPGRVRIFLYDSDRGRGDKYYQIDNTIFRLYYKLIYYIIFTFRLRFNNKLSQQNIIQNKNHTWTNSLTINSNISEVNKERNLMIIDQKTKRESLTTPKPAVSVTVSPNWKNKYKKFNMIFQRFNKVVKVKLTIIIVLHMKLCAFKVNFCKAYVLSFFQISWISSWNKNSSNSGTLGKTWVGTCNCRNSGPDPGRLAQIFWMNPSTGATFVMDFPGRFRLCSHSVSWS